jgi:hypothetical protein
MSTTVYVARSLGVDASEVTIPATVGTIVGGDDALDSRDGDTSYIHIRRVGPVHPDFPDHTQMPFRWEKLSGPTPNPSTTTSITLEGECRKGDDSTAASFAVLGLTWDGVGVSVPAPWGFATPDYVFGTSSVDPFYTEALTDGRPWIIAPAEPAFASIVSFRLTYLIAVIESGARPLRQFHTDWGQGASPPRAFGGTSYARTGRAFGDR